jgi:hypothetical protein
MRLLIVYIAVLAVGGIVCFLVGDFADHIDTRYGLAAFLVMFFFNLWVSWRIAILLTGPKKVLGGA